jgi:hypothetical protein
MLMRDGSRLVRGPSIVMIEGPSIVMVEPFIYDFAAHATRAALPETTLALRGRSMLQRP